MTRAADKGNVYDFSKMQTARHKRDLRDDGPLDLYAIIEAQADIAQAGLDVKKVVDVITTRTQTLTGSTGAIVELRDGDEVVYWSGSGVLAEHVGLRLPIGNSLSGLCIQQDMLLTCRDSESDSRVNLKACRQVGARSALVTPLKCDGNLVGVLKVISDVPAAYAKRDVEVLETLAAFMGSTLNSAMQHAEVSKQVARAAAAEADAEAHHERERLRIVSVIAAKGIRPVFQPIVNMETGTVVGHEALSRFEAPDNIPIDAWFEMAGRVGMCFDLESACIRAIADATERALDLPGYISVNVSPRTLLDFDFATLPRRGAQGGWVLEITEHSEVKDYTVLARRVKELQQQGFRIAIDDAGAGYASLRHVLKLSPDIIKLDLSITRGIDTSPRHQQLASAIIAFSIDTGISLIAEGVETASEQETLIRLHVAYGQGYLFGRPAPAQLDP